jgi:Tfp pilus assembly protein PilX
MSLARNQQGFSPLIIIILLLILALLGFGGWRVWESKKDKDKSASSSSSEPSPISSAAEEPTASALNYVKPPSEVYQVALPEGWVKATCPGTPDLLFLAPSTDKLGKCDTESGGTVAIGKNSGNTGHPETFYTSDPQYGSVAYTSITLDGITGYKVSYTVAAESISGYPPVGTQQTQYVLFDGTNTFTIVYTRFAGDADLAATVQTMAETFDKL